MSTILMVLISISMAVLSAISVYRFIRQRNVLRFIIQLLILCFCFSGFFFLFYKDRILIPKGNGSDEIYFVIVLYLFIVAGMSASHCYSRFSTPKKKRESFDLGLFIAPVFASPLVVLPLLAAFQNADVDLTIPQDDDFSGCI